MKGEDLLYVVAIDFGTTFSGYAFSTKTDFELNPLKIKTNSGWNDGTGICLSLKTPTCLLLNHDKTERLFGYEAENKYATLVENGNHENWYYFRRFKMCLHKNDEITRESMIEDEQGKKLNALDIFASGIEFLKGHFLDLINKSVKSKVTADDAFWVITVPAIWSDKARQFMYEAAVKAGINEKNVSLALEPEAAAMFCKELELHRADDQQTTMTSFEPGSKFMVADLGGGTVDVTVHEVLESGSLRELHRATGGPWGGTEVEKEYFKRMRLHMGEETYLNFERENLDDKLFLQRNIELRKRELKSDDSGTVKIRLPLSLIQMFAMSGAVLNQTMNLKDGLGISKIVGDKILIQYEFFKSLFERPLSGIISHLKGVLNHEETRSVSTIILVGGFAESDIVRSAISREFPTQRVIVPVEPGLAVLKGAVILGHSLKGIARRKCRYTYGIEVSDTFKPGIHPEAKRRSYPQSERCVDIFFPIMNQDEEIIVGKTFVEQVFYPANPDDKGVRITIYVAENTCPKFITDEGCQRLGYVDVPLPIKRGGTNRQITVRMSFDYSKIKFVGTDETTGKCYVGTCDFLR